MLNINNDLSNNNLEKSISNIEHHDLLLLGNSELYNKYLSKKNNNYNNISEDFNKYKKQIKSTINELFILYLDCSSNLNSLLTSNNENIKYNNYFYLFISSLIDNIKAVEFKNSIQNELLEYENNQTNKNNKNNKNDKNDISNNILELNEYLFNIKEKKSTLDEFVTVKNIVFKNKILPKKR